MKSKLWQLLLKASVMMVVLSINYPVLAAEEVIFTYGPANQSVSIEELEKFAQTGDLSPSLQFLFKYSKQNPETVRSALNKTLPANQILISNIFNTTIGESVLDQTSQLLHTKSHRSSREALRSSLIISAQGDNEISLLELLQNYPTKQVYLDSKNVASSVKKVSELLNTIDKNLRLPLTLLKDWLEAL